MKYLTVGPGLGNAFWMPVGTCDDEESSPECRGKPKNIYVDNRPTGYLPCSKLYMGKGLVPSLMEDTTSLNPLEIGSSMAGEGRMGSNCTMQEKMVGKLVLNMQLF